MALRRHLCLLVLSCAAVVGCGEDSTFAADDSWGSVDVALTLPGGFEINHVLYAVSGAGILPMTGVIDTSGGANDAAVTLELSSGSGYLVSLSAADAGGGLYCEGSAIFDVVSSQTSGVRIDIKCSESSTNLNRCARVANASATPANAPLGSTIALSATAEDTEGDPIEYSWTGPGGSFSAPDAAGTSFTCQDAGTHTLILVVSDDEFQECIRGWVTSITCSEVAP